MVMGDLGLASYNPLRFKVILSHSVLSPKIAVSDLQEAP
jgi:hypothetical protein